MHGVKAMGGREKLCKCGAWMIGIGAKDVINGTGVNSMSGKAGVGGISGGERESDISGIGIIGRRSAISATKTEGSTVGTDRKGNINPIEIHGIGSIGGIE